MTTTIIKSSRRRTICIQIHQEKGVIVRAPRLVSNRRIEKFLREKKDWIQEKLTEQQEKQAKKPKYKFVPGEKFPLLGELISPPVHTQPKLIEWYKIKALDHLTKRTNKIAQKLSALTGHKIKPGRVRIRTYKSRWGTCFAKNDITYNWKIIMANPEIIDYLIAHELTHILHKNHGKNFKKTLARLDPEFKKHQKWLRTEGQNLSI